MRILLDENLPRKLAGHLIGHECRTVVECGWSGKKNGELLAEADPLFDLLLTLDKNLPYQQDLTYKTNCRADRSGAFQFGFRTSFRSFQSVLWRSRVSCGAREHSAPASRPHRLIAVTLRRRD
jgi:hypothetical protein